MPNQKYSQVNTLLVQNKLHWATDAISAMLFTGATFDAAQKKVSELGVRPVATVPIMGRTVGEGGEALGYPATFDKVDPDTVYQVIVGLDDGLHDLLLLAFIDNNDREGLDEQGQPVDTTLTVKRQGSLIIRPVEESTIDGQSVVLPPTMGVWMRL
jgi:hypothetical protein